MPRRLVRVHLNHTDIPRRRRKKWPKDKSSYLKDKGDITPRADTLEFEHETISAALRRGLPVRPPPGAAIAAPSLDLAAAARQVRSVEPQSESRKTQH